MSTLALLLILAQAAPAPEFDFKTRERILQHSPLPPPPPDPTNRVADDPRAAELGQSIFYDARFSKDGSVSCATCHAPAQAFTDGRAVSRGLADGTRNAPSLYNVAQQRWLFWDGRADSVWAQALEPLQDADEMGNTPEGILRVIDTDERLRAAYERVFGGLAATSPEERQRGLVNVGKALAAFQRRLVSAGSPFDRYASAMRANDLAAQNAYPPAARRGLALFVGRGNCRLCHAGPLFSDGEFHDIGIPERDGSTTPAPHRHAGLAVLLTSPFRASGPCSDSPDSTRARELASLAVTPELYGQVRTPSLRNVARTAPYMHAGQFATLADVLAFYSTRTGARPPGHHGESILAPLHFTPTELADLHAFLETLTDESLPDTYKQPRRP